MIEGQTKTGVTLFKLEDGVDNGDIILQEEFPILFEDTIKEVCKKQRMHPLKYWIKHFSLETKIRLQNRILKK